MKVEINPYPSKKNEKEYKDKSFKYTLTHTSGASFSVLNYGAIISEINVPDINGQMDDVELGHKNLDEYMINKAWHGASVGRSANRIAGASFEINGKKYTLEKNDGDNNLHGGSPCFQNVFWTGKVLTEQEARQLTKTSPCADYNIVGETVLFEYVSPDGAAGFPGNLNAQILYAWTKEQMLLILFVGKADEQTIFAPTNHSYFNLAGQGNGLVLDHFLYVDAKKITNKKADGVPDGTYSEVKNTVFDFNKSDKIKKMIDSDHPQIRSSKGLDQNYCLAHDGNPNKCVASLFEPNSGRKMDVYTSFPGMQVYTGNHLGDTASKNDLPYNAYSGICLEAQMYPDSIHHSHFPSAVIKPGERKEYFTGYRFSVDNCP